VDKLGEGRVSDGISKVRRVEFSFVWRVPFFHFWWIFVHFGRFHQFWGPDFPFFDTFQMFSDGILANQTRGRTIAHPETLLKPRNWAPELTGFFILVQVVDLGLKRWFSWVQLT
jgi:hypothetical protein